MIRDFLLALNLIFVIIALNSSTMTSLAEGRKENSSAEACRKFSSNFHKVVARQAKGNVVDSPLSTHLLLSYLLHGSDDLTAEEITVGLCLSEAEKIHSWYGDFVKILRSTNTIELNLANAIFLQTGVQLKKTFLTVGTDFYNFTIDNVDFRENVLSVETINSWASKNTNGKIKDVISTDDIHDDTKVVLVNAIYFKGLWKHPFDVGETQTKLFHLSKTRNTLVSVMYKEFKYFHGEIPSMHSRFLEIPYTENNVDMVIILPDEIEGLKFAEENFDWNAVVKAPRFKSLTRLYLPKFKIEATIDLKNVLIELGFTSMFKNNADFTKMSDSPLKVDSVIQKAFIEINELGAEAAASTVVKMRLKRSLEIEENPYDFLVDRPFIVAIRHLPDDTPLFLSSVMDFDTIPKKDEL